MKRIVLTLLLCLIFPSVVIAEDKGIAIFETGPKEVITIREMKKSEKKDKEIMDNGRKNKLKNDSDNEYEDDWDENEDMGC